MGNFLTDVIQKDPRYHDPAKCRDLALLEPGFRAKVEAIIADAAVEGITLCVSETYRSPARQEMLFKQGATQIKSLDTHSMGMAADFYKLIDGKASWSGDWGFLRDLANKHGAISGLDWGLPNIKHSFVDSDHVQGCTLAQQSALLAGNWYPDAPVG